MAITLTQLNSFMAVVRAGSVTAAAEELVVTQPSVSAALASLSREVGVDLVERDGRNVRLSPAGEAFAPYAAHVLGLLEQGRSAAHEAADTTARKVRITAVTTAGEFLAPALIQAFAATHPGIEVELDVGNRERVFRAVRQHEADVAIAGRPPSGGELVAIPFLENEVVLITAPEDPLAARTRVAVAMLADRAWLLREEGSGTRAMSDEFLQGNGLAPRVLTLGSNGAIKQAAAVGLGVALQSKVAVQLELDAGVLATITLAEEIPARAWYVLRSAVGPVRPPVADFLAFVASQGLEDLAVSPVLD